MLAIFDPLERIRKILRKLKTLIELENKKLKENRTDKLVIVECFNRTILREAQKAGNIFLSKREHYEQNPINTNTLNVINLQFEDMFKRLDRITAEIEKDKQELRQAGQEFINEWVKNIDYSTILARIDIISLYVEKLQSPIKSETRKLRENPARILIQNGKVLTRFDEFERLAMSCGYVLARGADHIVVYTTTGKKITEIPLHKNIPKGTALKITRALAEAEFKGRKSA